MLLNALTILVFLFFAFSVIIFFSTPFFSKVPFIPVRKKVLNDVVKALNLSDKSVLYDLGCGNGRVLFAVSKAYKDVSCIGVEKAPFPYLLAKGRQLFSRNKKVSILYGDLFKINISSVI